MCLSGESVERMTDDLFCVVDVYLEAWSWSEPQFVIST
jgi:hypothetical protein